MDTKELIELITALKASGVSSYKDEFGREFTFFQQEIHKPTVPMDAPVELPAEIEHKVEELTSLLKLSDADLVDRLFPDAQQEDEDE
jgi:hypothetical protein